MFIKVGTGLTLPESLLRSQALLSLFTRTFNRQRPTVLGGLDQQSANYVRYLPTVPCYFYRFVLDLLLVVGR